MNIAWLILAMALSAVFSLLPLLALSLIIENDRLFQIIGLIIWLALIYPCYLLIENIGGDIASLLPS